MAVAFDTPTYARRLLAATTQELRDTIRLGGMMGVSVAVVVALVRLQ